MNNEAQEALRALENIEEHINNCEVMCVEIRDNLRFVERTIRLAEYAKIGGE